jgi:hypothetical protein
MCNQNISSNKFNLILTTTLSSNWCTAIFTKSRSLHYVLKKVEETVTKVNDTKENDAFQIDHVRRTQETSETRTTLSKEKQTHSQEMTRKGTQTLPEQRGQKCQ